MTHEQEFLSKMKHYFTEHDFSDKDFEKIGVFLKEYRGQIESNQKPVVIYQDVVKEKKVFVYKEPLRISHQQTEDEIILSTNTAKQIIQDACTFLQFDPDQLKSKSRKREKVIVRHMLFMLLRLETVMTLKGIGEIMGGYDHTTVIHGIQQFKDLMETNKALNNQFVKLYEYINQKNKAA